MGTWKAAGVSSPYQAFLLKIDPSDLIDVLQAFARRYIILPQGQSRFEIMVAALLALERNNIEPSKFR